MAICTEMQCDFKKPAKEILIDLINFANKSNMTRKLYPDETFFTEPKALPRESDMNTEIRLAKVLGFRIPQETEAIQYNRIRIDQIAKQMPWDFTLQVDPKKRYQTTHDLLDDLFEVFPVKLLPEDVVLEEVHFDLSKSDVIWNDDIVDGKSIIKNNITLNMSEESIGYLGSLTFRVVPKPIDINVVVRTTKVGSFRHHKTYMLSN